ncbi:MAG: lytic murein transglycosylase B [Endozoicomonadaceae bacterium]|nr:lytic murein transglycosylase B [Endozoicomonadaceae bacterium]
MKSLLSRWLFRTVEYLSVPLSLSKKHRLCAWMVGSVMIGSSVMMQVQADDFTEKHEVRSFIDEMVIDESFNKKELEALFRQVKNKDRILELISRPAERSLEWWEYRNRFISEHMVRRGVEFWKQHQKTLEKAHKKYGVPPYVILGILGVETRYGHFSGGFRVIDALSTLGFNYPRRASFFKKQLKEFLILSREQGFDPLLLTGSYAGAMGIPQFMPSSYREYAVDFDDDGKADIWNSPVDAIGSIASYLNRHNWKKGEPVVSQAQVKGKRFSEVLSNNSTPTIPLSKAHDAGWVLLQELPASSQVRGLMLQGKESPEYWLTLHNFYVITRYNHSDLYAMTVYQMGKQVESQYQIQLQEQRQGDHLQTKAETVQ